MIQFVCLVERRVRWVYISRQIYVASQCEKSLRILKDSDSIIWSR